MRRGKIPHGGDAKEGYVAGGVTAAVKILTEDDVDVDFLVIGIFDAGGELGHQALFGVENIADTGGEGVGKFSLLKYVEVGAQLQVGGGVSAGDFSHAGFADVEAQAEYVPLSSYFQGEVGFFGEGAGGIGQAGGKGDIGLGMAIG